MKQYPFRWSDLQDTAKVSVDSHSSSPAFGHESRGLLFDLAKFGAVNPQELVAHTNPPGEDDILADLMRKEIAQKALYAQHPELLEHMGGKKKK